MYCTEEPGDEWSVLFADLGPDPGERESEAPTETGRRGGTGARRAGPAAWDGQGGPVQRAEAGATQDRGAQRRKLVWNCVHTVNCLFITYIVSVILLKLLLSLTHNQVSNNFIADIHLFFSTGNRKPVLSVRGNERSIPYDGSKENQRIRGCPDKSGAWQNQPNQGKIELSFFILNHNLSGK